MCLIIKVISVLDCPELFWGFTDIIFKIFLLETGNQMGGKEYKRVVQLEETLEDPLVQIKRRKKMLTA